MNDYNEYMYKSALDMRLSSLNVTAMDEPTASEFMEQEDYRRLESGFSPMSRNELQDLLDS